MRITKYELEINKDKIPTLVKEKAVNYEKISLINPENINAMMNDIFNARSKAEEHVWILALNTKNNPIGIFEVSHGTNKISIAEPREIFIRLCLCGADNFILIHNHPSGDTSPSMQDLQATEKIKNASKIMNINILDHIIIGDDYYSFAENKML